MIWGEGHTQLTASTSLYHSGLWLTVERRLTIVIGSSCNKMQLDRAHGLVNYHASINVCSFCAHTLTY